MSRGWVAGVGSQGATGAFALTLETVSSAVWLRTCSTVALKLSTLINHPGFKQALVAGNFSELPHTQSAAWLCRIVVGVEREWIETGLGVHQHCRHPGDVCGAGGEAAANRRLAWRCQGSECHRRGLPDSELHPADHANAQPPDEASKDNHSSSPLGLDAPAFPDVLVGRQYLEGMVGYGYPDKCPEHPQGIFPPCRSKAIGPTSRRSKAKREVGGGLLQACCKITPTISRKMCCLTSVSPHQLSGPCSVA